MSKATEFLDYLGEDARSRDALVEASGEDAKTVSNRLTVLRGKGLAKRTADGWVKVVKSNGSTPPINDSATPPPQAEPEEGRSQASNPLGTRRGGRHVQLLP